MRRILSILPLLPGTVAVWLLISCSVWPQEELIRNGTFLLSEGKSKPDHWTVRLPPLDHAACRITATGRSIRVDAAQEHFSVGDVVQEILGIQGGKNYRIEVLAKSEKIKDRSASMMVRLSWRKGEKDLHPAGRLVEGPWETGSGLRFLETLKAPAEADRAVISLETKWPGEGIVYWEKASMKVTIAPAPRKVKIGTVYLRPERSSAEKNLQLFCEQIDQAGKLGLDIICLPEAILSVGVERRGTPAAEMIPGPSVERLGEAARRNHLWVVAGLYEKEGGRLYNTAVLLDRQGALAGKYRKVHLPREEWKVGFTPGSDYPVFRTDFGIIALQICYDYFFPETAALWRLKGAEIVLAPTWGTTFADQEGRVEGENIFRVRARDNGFFLVSSVYDGSSMVIDPMGRILASNRGQTGVFWAEADLSQKEALPWVGEWRSVGPHDRRPETYHPLIK